MKKLIYITFVGLIGILFSCEEDGDLVYIDENPVAPSIVTMPDLTLERNNGTDTLEFVFTPVDPGFQASVNYFLEASPAGENFANPIAITSGTDGTSLKITVSDLNGILLKKLTADEVSSVDFRVRSVLVVDSGTGAPGTSTDPFEYTSDIENANVTLYGLPRLDLLNSGVDQKIESALGNGEYTGYVLLDGTMPFTLLDPDSNTEYGGAESVLEIDGPAIQPVAERYHRLTANTKDLSYELIEFNVGLIGSATPGGWDTDSPMEYDAASGLWSITTDLVVGHIKFRANNSWSGPINLGLGDDDNPEYTLDNLWNSGSSKDIPIDEAGSYTITLSIGSKYSATITKN
jgi:hypothetical protein